MNQVKGNGASSTLFQHDRPNKPQVSRFDLSRKVNFSLDTGMIVPVELLETYPGDRFRISNKMAIDTLPLVAPSLTNYKITTHYYYMKKRSMWKGWKTFSTKGRSGNENLTIPQVDLSNKYTVLYPFKVNNQTIRYLSDIYLMSQHSLSAFLGVPPMYSGVFGFTSSGNSASAYIHSNYLPYTPIIDSSTGATAIINAQKKVVDTGFKRFTRVSALPFVMYQSICKHYYVNPNLLQDNHALFPVEGDDDWILPYTIETGIANFISGKEFLSSGGKVNYTGVYSNDETDVDLRLLRYAMFDDDYFSTALKDLQRGAVETLDLSGIATFGNVPVTLDYQSAGDAGLISGKVSVLTDSDDDKEVYPQFSVDTNGNTSIIQGVNTWGSNQSGRLHAYIPGDSIARNLVVNTSALSGSNTVKLSMTASQLRSLIAMSVWQERNMRVDGSYNKMIYQHWSVNPRSEEYVPVYIGGTVGYLNFSTVIQNSESSSSSPLGSTAGFGSSGGSGSVCSDFVCPDHGYIMGVMIIKPETIYQQGVERLLTEITFDDFAQPELQGLSPEGILNKELYISGDAKDNELFAYQERYTYLKVRQNVNRGLMQCKPDKDLLFSAYTQARWFDSLPKFSYQFLCMSPDNLRRDWLAYPSYPAFRCQFLSEVFVTRKLAYTSEPNTFGF